MRASAEMYFDSHDNSYYVSEEDNVCVSEEGIKPGYDKAKQRGGDGDCFSNTDSWMAWVKLEPGKDKAWCADSQGSSQEIDIKTRPILNKNVTCNSFLIKD